MIKISIYYRDVDILFRGEKSGGGGGEERTLLYNIYNCTIIRIEI